MRPLSAYVRNLTKVPRYLGWFAKIFFRLRRPASFLMHYLRQTSPANRVVELRDQTRINLSGHPHDVITVFVIFVRQDYGRLDGAGVVVDIGANIGSFALYAARSGARRVLAYEPNAGAFQCLERNVHENRLRDVIQARRLAVTARAGEKVWFPVNPSAYNRIAEPGSDNVEVVGTTSLAEILRVDAPSGIDMLKLDCEGAEYEILFNSPAELERVREIRMEYHGGRTDELRGFLQNLGFRVTRLQAGDKSVGSLWARKA